MADSLDMKQILFTNLKLMGFDPGSMETSLHVPFEKNMFDLPNKKGAEAVLYFLFNKLNPVMCREVFRDCWPVMDRQQEKNFRVASHNWLVNIAKTEPDAHLPRIVASQLMFPGGEKFYKLLFQFSSYVMRKELKTESAVPEYEYLRYPEVNDQTAGLGDVMGKSIQCSIARLRKKFFEEAQRTVALQNLWHQSAKDLTKEYRKLTKELREGEHLERVLKQKAVEAGVSRGSPMIHRRRSESHDHEIDPLSTARAQLIQQVRDKWKQIQEFSELEAAEREVIESIVDRTMSQHRIDAGCINIKVPDLLLRECEQEIRRRHVDNTFHGGKLNLVSVLQLWNLCLHLYIERLHQEGVPDFTTDIETITSQVHTSHAYLTNAKTLEKEMTINLPKLKESVEQLRESLDNRTFQSSTPQRNRSTAFGLGLLEPSPTMSFTPKETTTGTSPVEPLRRMPQDETTPEAASKLADVISKKVSRGTAKLHQGSPVYAPRVDITKAAKKKVPASKMPRKVSRPQSKPTKSEGASENLQFTPTKSSGIARDILNMSSQSANTTLRDQSLTSSGDRTLTGVTSFTGPSPVPNQTSPKQPLPKTPQRDGPYMKLSESLSPSDIIVNRIMDVNFEDNMDEDDGNISHELQRTPGPAAQENQKSASSNQSPLSILSNKSQNRSGIHKTTNIQQSPRSLMSDLSHLSHHSSPGRSSEHSRSPSHSSPRLQVSHHSQLDKPLLSQDSPRSNRSKHSVSFADSSEHSISSDLSRPSGLLDEKEQSPETSIHSGHHSSHFDMSNLKLFATGQLDVSGKLDSSRNTLQDQHNSSFELEQPEFLSSGETNKGSVHSGLAKSPAHSRSPREFPVISQQGDIVDYIKKSLSSDSIPIGHGSPFRLELDSEQNEDLSHSDDSCPTSARALGRALMEEECDILPMPDQPEPEMMLRSSLSEEIRTMLREAIQDSESPQPGSRLPTSHSQDRMTRSFSNITDQLERFTAASDKGSKIDIQAGGDGSHIVADILSSSFGKDVENLEDIQLPNMSFENMDEEGFEDAVKTPGPIDSVQTESSADLLYPNPRFPLTNLSVDSNDILVSLTPHKPATHIRQDNSDVLMSMPQRPMPDESLHLQGSPWILDMSSPSTSLARPSRILEECDLIEGQELELVDDLNLDDSFVPLKEGFQFEGITPQKPNMAASGGTEESTDSLMTTLQMLRSKTSSLLKDI